MTGNESASRTTHGSLLREAALTLGAALVVVGLGAGLLLFDPGLYWHDDAQMQHLATRCDVARAWRAGEVPLLSPYSWHCGALAAEYQYAIFSVFEAVCVTVVFSLGLTLPATAAVLAILQLVVLAAGAFRLARLRGLSSELALLVALVTSLNGWVIVWGALTWFPGLATFAWLPWFWWGLERAVRPGSLARFVPAGVFLYLIATGGWPFTVLMSVLVALAVAVRVWHAQGSPWPVWPVVAAGVLGVLLSAPAWLMLTEYYRASVRATLPAQPDLACVVPPAALLGLVFPAWVTEWNFTRVTPHQCIELTGGLVPLVGLIVGLRRAGRRVWQGCAVELVLLLGVLLLALLPSLGTFRWSFRWLPLFFLLLALTAAHALAELRASPTVRPANLGLGCLCLVAPVGLTAYLSGAEPREYVGGQALALTSLALAWATGEWLLAPGWRRWLPCLVMLVSTGLAYAEVRRFLVVPTWPLSEAIRQPEPLEPGRRYFSVSDVSDVIEEDAEPGVLNTIRGRNAGLRPGNTWMYAGVAAINGYSPIMPLGLYDVFRFVSPGIEKPEHAERLLRQWSGPDGLLRFVGVDGLIVADKYARYAQGLEQQGWHRVASVEGGTVYHRAGPLAPRVRTLERVAGVADWDAAVFHLRAERGTHTPLVLGNRSQEFAAAPVELLHEGRNEVVVAVANPATARDALVVFLRPWFPGYRATLNGSAVPVEVLDLVVPAVRVPAGAQGEVRLVYRPTGLVLGRWLVGTALAILLGVGLFVYWWRGAPERQDLL